MADETCAVETCTKSAWSRGWCNAHYQRWRLHGDPLHGGELQVQMHGATVEERLWARVDRSGGDGACWPWVRGATHPFGYGQLGVDGRPEGSHRVAWTVTHGEIPDGAVIAHRCDNPPCCNPAHLFLTTNSGNIRDMHRKGRQTDRRALGEESPFAKLTETEVREIRRRNEAGEGQRPLAKEFGVSRSTVKDLVQRRTWQHVP